MRYRSSIAVLAALGVGIAVGWLAHGGEKTVTRTRDLAPAGARTLDAQALRAQSGPSQVAVAWLRNPDRYPSEFGLTIWQRRSTAGAWQRIYERRITQSKEQFIHDIRMRTADVTRDGRDDLLVFEDLDGSAGNYVYRLLTTDGGRVRQLAARKTSMDETTVFAEYGELISYDGVGKNPKTLADIHCCPLYWQRTVRRWNGKRLVTAATERAKRRPPLFD
jgi:hypothetical protein